MIAALRKSKPANFAELHARLGGVPLERIRMTPFPGSATEADLENNRGLTCELIDGVLVEKAMGTRESLLGIWIATQILNYVDSDDLGVVLGEAGFIRLKTGQVRAPDATFIPWSSFPDEELPPEAYWSVKPSLIVEVLSSDNTKAEIDRKLGEFFAFGCKRAWVIDPKARTAKVHTSVARFQIVDENGILNAGRALPGFKLYMSDLFAKLKRRKPSK